MEKKVFELHPEDRVEQHTYHVTLKQTHVGTVYVKAESEQQAIDIATRKLEIDADDLDFDWEIESCENSAVLDDDNKED